MDWDEEGEGYRLGNGRHTPDSWEDVTGFNPS